ncbi:hypothetical protein Tco_0167561 [Tanacetum coccineum]
MDISAISCSSCNANVESANHIFFECIIVTEMWKLVYRWCEIPFVQASSLEAFKDWFISWHASKEKRNTGFTRKSSIDDDGILDALSLDLSNVDMPWLICALGMDAIGDHGKVVLCLVAQYGVSNLWIWCIEALRWIRRIHVCIF